MKSPIRTRILNPRSHVVRSNKSCYPGSIRDRQPLLQSAPRVAIVLLSPVSIGPAANCRGREPFATGQKLWLPRCHSYSSRCRDVVKRRLLIVVTGPPVLSHDLVAGFDSSEPPCEVVERDRGRPLARQPRISSKDCEFKVSI
ncbi:hypothetical protein AAHA92_21074 [Salvia divinorum]|uniref:Uncharacterized protein n=1 Tax=Salvia divinorum TaxID=28513 RepID=A0ABD1GKH0_SALDI